MSSAAGSGQGWRAWLGSDAPTSRRQARLGEIYRFGDALLHHPLAFAGLAIVVALVLVAALAPLLAPYAPIGAASGGPPAAARTRGTGSAPTSSAATSSRA